MGKYVIGWILGVPAIVLVVVVAAAVGVQSSLYDKRIGGAYRQLDRGRSRFRVVACDRLGDLAHGLRHERVGVSIRAVPRLTVRGLPESMAHVSADLIRAIAR